MEMLKKAKTAQIPEFEQKPTEVGKFSIPTVQIFDYESVK